MSIKKEISIPTGIQAICMNPSSNMDQVYADMKKKKDINITKGYKDSSNMNDIAASLKKNGAVVNTL